MKIPSCRVVQGKINRFDLFMYLMVFSRGFLFDQQTKSEREKGIGASEVHERKKTSPGPKEASQAYGHKGERRADDKDGKMSPRNHM